MGHIARNQLTRVVHFTKKSVVVAAISILFFTLLYSPSTFLPASQNDSTHAAASVSCGDYCPTLTPVAIYKRYKASAYVPHNYSSTGLNISIPSDWNSSTSSQSINEISTFRSPIQSDSDRFHENIVIKEGRYTKNLTLSDFSSATVAGLQGLEDFKLIENSFDSTISGVPANKIAYSYTENKIPYMGMQLSTVLGSSYLTFTYNAERGRYAEYLPTINEILSSVKIVPKILDQNKNNSTLIAFKNETEGIALEYPANWNKGPFNYLSSIFTIYAPLNNLTDFYYDNIRINVDARNETLTNVTAKDKVEEYEKTFNNTLLNFRTLQKQESTISGNPSYGITFIFTGNDGEEHKLQRIVTIKDDKIYTIIYDSLSDTFDLYSPVLNQLLSSLEIS